MSLATDGMMSRKWQNSAARRRAQARYRAHMIRLAGMSPEDISSAATRYAATTGEIRRWAYERCRRKG